MIFYNHANNFLQLTAGIYEEISGAGLCYMGLLTATPTADGVSINEISTADYPSYQRILLCANSAQSLTSVWGSAEKGVLTNSKPFAGDSQCEEESGWPECSHWCLFTAKTGGTPLIADVFRDPDGTPDANGLYPATTLKVGHKQVPVFRKGALQLTLK